jgi:hypothetical protein
VYLWLTNYMVRAIEDKRINFNVHVNSKYFKSHLTFYESDIILSKLRIEHK